MIAVLIPTFRRPGPLEAALRSVFAQAGVSGLLGEIIVVDNAPEASARGLADRLRPLSPVPLRYVHAPTPGVATARNAGLKAVSAPLVAFLDDDEVAAPDWLRRLHAVHVQTGADVTFGPVQGRAPAAPAWKRAYLERFFSRTGPAASGVTDRTYGCGASLMTRATALAGDAPFDVSADRTGGEDDRLFAALKARGARFAWAADALAFEDAPPARATLRYALARAAGYGQSPCQACWRRRNLPGVAAWMGIGTGQALGFALLALAEGLLGRKTWLDRLDRAARGFGKLIWFVPLRFYGAPGAGSAEQAPDEGGLRPHAVQEHARAAPARL